jgi:mono/diheme cytochrome c family protein
MNRTRLSFLLAAILFLASCADTTHSDHPKVDENATEEGAPGQALFEARCASCHGADGTAGIANAANLQTSTLNQGALLQTIANGRNAMPAFKGQLSEGELNSVADYVLRLRDSQ